METFFFVLGFAVVSTSLYFLNEGFKRSLRKKESSDWEIGDRIIAEIGSELWRAMSDPGDAAELSGWDGESIYIKMDGSIHKFPWSSLKVNKSALWRRNHNKCKSYMGKDPGFGSSLKAEYKFKGFSKDQLKELLEKAILEEDYEKAESIKKAIKELK
jgi:hypothetical protein